MSTRFHRPALLLLLLAALTTVVTAAPPARTPADELVEEHWYIMEIAGVEAGWMRTASCRSDTRARTETEVSIRISRGGTEIAVHNTSVFVEAPDGTPLSMHSRNTMGQQPVETDYVFSEDVVTVTTTQSGRATVRALPLPEGTWLAPAATQRYILERMKAGAKTIEYRTITPDSGVTPITVRHERTTSGRYAVDGREIPTTVWATHNSMMPGIVATEQYSSDGKLVHQSVDMGMGAMVSRLVTREDALRAGGGPAPELMVNLFVPTSEPIERARSTRTSVLRLRMKKGDMPVLPTAGAQRFEPADEPGTGIVRVNIDDNVPASAEERADPSYTAASSMANADDAMVKALATSATRGLSEDPFARAEAMRKYVHTHITAKALDTAFATASETARMRRGDCSEHGVLLCAMLRADGIPARVATGLIYADQFAGERDIFGWHMWTQALIDGRWVDFDATLRKRYDATHVLTGTSALAEGSNMSELAAAVALMGNLSIDVVEYGHAKVEPVRTPERIPAGVP